MKNRIVSECLRKECKLFIGWNLPEFGYSIFSPERTKVLFTETFVDLAGDREYLRKYSRFIKSFIIVGIYHYEDVRCFSREEVRNRLWKLRMKREFGYLEDHELKRLLIRSKAKFPKKVETDLPLVKKKRSRFKYPRGWIDTLEPIVPGKYDKLYIYVNSLNCHDL